MYNAINDYRSYIINKIRKVIYYYYNFSNN